MLFKRLKKFDPKEEKEFINEIEANGGVEKGDMFAMIISALLVFVPTALLVLGIIVLVAYLFI